MSLIQIKGLTHRFADGTFGVKDIDLMVNEGEFLALAGVNGSGKTTLCRHLNGLLKPTEGEILVDGLNVPGNLLKVRQMVGMVFQNADTQIVGETVYSDIAFGPENLGLHRAEIDDRVEAAIEMMGLQDQRNQKPYLLSGGEKKRLAIAGVMAMNPRILVLDEPFSNLDYPGSCQLLKHILRIHKSGHTIIIITHELEKIIADIDRLVIMHDGRIVRSGDPLSLISEVEMFGVREPCASKFGQGLQSWLT